MKVDSANRDKLALRKLLQEQYGLDVVELRFVPQGEESCGYILETPHAARYFVKVYEHRA